MVHFMSNEDVCSLTMTSILSILDVFYTQQQSNPSNNGPFQLMNIPTQHLLTKFLCVQLECWIYLSKP